jgi:hypothetical protein
MNKEQLAQFAAQLLTADPSNINRALSVGTEVTPFGCCNFFDPCSDGILSLHYSGRLPLLDWMGFNVTEECYRSLEFITFVSPAGSTVGYLADPCADPNGIEFGSTKLTVEDFGRIGRLGPTREIMKPLNYCKTRPIVRLDGSPVTNEDEWDMKFVMDQILNDLAQLLIVGDASTGGQFDGLENWVTTGYVNAMLDSTIIEWNSNPMSGGTGVTWNGGVVTDNAYNLIDIMLEIFRKFRQRASWSPLLRAQTPGVGDFILVMPTALSVCLLDYFTCWSVCPGVQYSEANLNTLEARDFRDGLNGGKFGHGQITLDGFVIPIMAYDWSLIKGDAIGDMYFLTGAYGGMRIWEGEHLSASRAAAENGDQGIASTDGGRVLVRKDTENLCKVLKAWLHPRLFCSAPWMQARIQNVTCDTAGGYISPDPTTAYYPDQTQTPAACP